MQRLSQSNPQSTPTRMSWLRRAETSEPARRSASPLAPGSGHPCRGSDCFLCRLLLLNPRTRGRMRNCGSGRRRHHCDKDRPRLARRRVSEDLHHHGHRRFRGDQRRQRGLWSGADPHDHERRVLAPVDTGHGRGRCTAHRTVHEPPFLAVSLHRTPCEPIAGIAQRRDRAFDPRAECGCEKPVEIVLRPILV